MTKVSCDDLSHWQSQHIFLSEYTIMVPAYTKKYTRQNNLRKKVQRTPFKTKRGDRKCSGMVLRKSCSNGDVSFEENWNIYVDITKIILCMS